MNETTTMFMKIRNILLSVCLSCAASGMAQQTVTLTLDDAIARARSR